MPTDSKNHNISAELHEWLKMLGNAPTTNSANEKSQEIKHDCTISNNICSVIPK